MKTFQYTALDQNGQETTGSIEAASQAEAISNLRGQTLYPTRVEEAVPVEVTFLYTALDANGQEVKGEIQAISEAAAVAKLLAQTTYPTAVTKAVTPDTSRKEASTSSRPGKINYRLRLLLEKKEEEIDRRAGWSLLGQLVASGVPILQSLKIVSGALRFPKHQLLFLDVHEAVKAGESMVPSLSGKVPAYEAAIIDVGEETGQLPEMLLKIAALETQEAFLEDAQLTLVSMVATLLDAGFPLVRALVVTAESFKDEPRAAGAAKAAAAIAEKIQAGATFAESLKSFPELFDPMCVALAKAGELGGVLEITMNRCRDEMLAAYRRYGYAV